MNREANKIVATPQARCHLGLARADITPPIRIYHRMWGAAVHDRAVAIHRPLLGTVLWLERSTHLTLLPGAW